jgi:hypothetical protein
MVWFLLGVRVWPLPYWQPKYFISMHCTTVHAVIRKRCPMLIYTTKFNNILQQHCLTFAMLSVIMVTVEFCKQHRSQVISFTFKTSLTPLAWIIEVRRSPCRRTLTFTAVLLRKSIVVYRRLPVNVRSPIVEAALTACPESQVLDELFCSY